MYIHAHVYTHFSDKSLRFGLGVNFGENYRNWHFEVVRPYNSKDIDNRFWKHWNLIVETVENNIGKIVV